MSFSEVVQYLEALTIMPKTMPGLDKIRDAVLEKSWFSELKPEKIITVAGTNGKGTTCAVLEALLLAAGKNVGIYTSPHLIQTTERIRWNGKDISETEFVLAFEKNKSLIEKYQLSHFEALTLMAADFFFQKNYDFIVFEVGLGGTYDATNIFPNKYAVITKLGLDHQNILGNTIQDIARNKFGIIKPNAIVVHHRLPEEVTSLKNKNATWFEARRVHVDCHEGNWFLDSEWGRTQINIIGERAGENAATALTLFEKLGFSPSEHLSALQNVRWPGRMQKIKWKQIEAPIYLSGDHNIQGIESLIEILKKYRWRKLHVIIGIGQDKSCEGMLSALQKLPASEFYLTVTPFKGLDLNFYPEWIQVKAKQKNKNVISILDSLTVDKDDLVIVTGSLYLVGEVLKNCP